MAEQRRTTTPAFYSQIDISQVGASQPAQPGGFNAEVTMLLREILAAQDRQNELLEELLNQVTATQRQRAAELGQWKQANPQLARKCRKAAEALSKVQTEYLDAITREVNENFEVLCDGEFMLNEFVDRFGPRVAHLNSLLQVLSQLAAGPETADPSS